VDTSYDHYGKPDDNTVQNAQSDVSVADDFGPLDPTDLERPAGHDAQLSSSASQRGVATRNVVSLGERIEALGARFVSRRKERDRHRAAPASVTSIESEKIVSLHVVAPDGQYIDGQLLHDTFAARGYQHGPMDIYHSMHNESAVFSIARMVMPGTFDVNNPASYQTPGITLFMQLPGPVPGDIAFDVLVSEAHELASALGCRILDNERSTLTRQTVQHLKDSISEFIHRQKFLNRVPG
jgi:cell division protein ZipA